MSNKRLYVDRKKDKRVDEAKIIETLKKVFRKREEKANKGNDRSG